MLQVLRPVSPLDIPSDRRLAPSTEAGISIPGFGPRPNRVPKISRQMQGPLDCLLGCRKPIRGI